MKTIVESALLHAKEEKSLEITEDLVTKPRIIIIGTGGAGNNTINRLSKTGIKGAENIAINTDKQHLGMVHADKKLLIGESITHGLGAGGYPEIGQKAAEMARSELTNLLGDVSLVFVTAGMGGGTGTGSAPIIAQVAKDQGAMVVGMVFMPFKTERARLQKADEGLENLRNIADTVIVLDNNRLAEFVPDLSLTQAFSVADEIIAQTVKGIIETITIPSLINLDYADLHTIMQNGGVAMMGIGESNGRDRVHEVVHDALRCPLLDVDYRGATGALIHITGGPDLTLGEANTIGELITSELHPRANVIWGARIQPTFEGNIRVTVVVTGVKSRQILGPETSMKDLRDVTFNLNIDYLTP